MLSNRPYLLRAFYQWIVDSGCTPILVIDVNHPQSKVPVNYAEGEEIVFNISNSAVRDLKISNELIEFKASFSGVVHIISAPVKAILAIYAEENGEGLFFDAEEDEMDANEKSEMLLAKDFENSAAISFNEDDMLQNQKASKAKPFLKLVE